VLYVHLPQNINTTEAIITFNQQQKDGKDLLWHKMDEGNGLFFINMTNVNCKEIITFKVKFLTNINTTLETEWISVLYDINFIEICQTSLTIYCLALFIIIVASIYSLVLLTHKMYTDCYKCWNLIFRK
jgi:hypothetical protein